MFNKSLIIQCKKKSESRKFLRNTSFHVINGPSTSYEYYLDPLFSIIPSFPFVKNEICKTFITKDFFSGLSRIIEISMGIYA